jgi:hypothetical protein
MANGFGKRLKSFDVFEDFGARIEWGMGKLGKRDSRENRLLDLLVQPTD